jgi:hypothetical protein
MGLSQALFVKYDHHPQNSEEVAKSRIGEYLYEKLRKISKELYLQTMGKVSR